MSVVVCSSTVIKATRVREGECHEVTGVRLNITKLNSGPLVRNIAPIVSKEQSHLLKKKENCSKIIDMFHFTILLSSKLFFLIKTLINTTFIIYNSIYSILHL